MNRSTFDHSQKIAEKVRHRTIGSQPKAWAEKIMDSPGQENISPPGRSRSILFMRRVNLDLSQFRLRFGAGSSEDVSRSDAPMSASLSCWRVGTRPPLPFVAIPITLPMS